MSFLQSIAIISTPARTSTSKDVHMQHAECDTHCKYFMRPQLWRVGIRSIHESASGTLDYTNRFQIFIVWGSIIAGLNVENCAGDAVKNDAIGGGLPRVLFRQWIQDKHN
jgi:hypothetical protein